MPPVALRPSANPALPIQPTLSTIAVVAIAIAALYFGREILVPFALAILLSFALAPLVTRLRRWGLPRVPSVLAVVAVAVVALAAFGVLVGGQIVQLANNVPTYQRNIEAKIHSLQSASGGGLVGRASGVLQQLGSELSGPKTGAEAKVDQPVPVEIRTPGPTPLQVIEDVAGPLLGPLGTAGIVVVFVIFMLLEREDLRDRFIRLVGSRDLHLTTEAINEAAGRVSRYLLMQLLVNASYGVPVGVGLYLIGVPNALLWGLLATILRFVPYIGSFVAAIFPVALAIAVDPGWSMLLWTLALILVLELITANAVEPLLYGHSTGVSTVALLLAAIFWTTLWGPVGLFLSAPLTVCLVVLGRYVPQFQFLDVMLGSEPVLAPSERLYQRLLADDPEEAIEIAEEVLEEKPLPVFQEEVVIPALRMAERDRSRGALDVEAVRNVARGALAVLAEIGKEDEATERGEGAEAMPARILCIGGKTEIDHAAAALWAQRLAQAGSAARALPPTALAPEAWAQLDLAEVGAICLVYLGAAPQAHARYVCRRLRRRAPEAEIAVGFWNPETRLAPGATPASFGADALCASLAEGVVTAEALDKAHGEAGEAGMVAPPLPTDEAARLAALERLGLLDTEAEEVYDRVTRRLADAFGSPIALLSLVDEARQFWKSACGLPPELAAARAAPRETSICGHVVAGNALLVVEDTARDPRFAGNPFLKQHGIRFYAGAPLRSSGGHAIGSLCVIDTRPRSFSERDRQLLQLIADEVMAEIEFRRPAPPAPEPKPTMPAEPAIDLVPLPPGPALGSA